MALKYVVKKTTFGFDDTKAEKYVARPFNVVNVDFKMLCDQVTKVGFVPRGTVKAVLDGLIDSLITYMEIGASVNLGNLELSVLPSDAKAKKTQRKSLRKH